jgi:hypothetical protein
MTNIYNPTISTSSSITAPDTSTITLTTGGAGASYTMASGYSNTAMWTSTGTNFTSTTGTLIMTVPNGEDVVRIEDTATLDIKGRVKMNGEFLDERLERIETLLQIPVRDVTMEAKYPKLKKLWEEYNYELSKLKTWDALKGDDHD